MPPKKQKAQKMALSEFFSETGGHTSWADEMEALPTAPAARDPMDGPRRGEPGYLDSMPDRGARFGGGPPSSREELPLPTVPPFTAFIGNLTFETEDDQLRDFFADIAPSSVRMVKDPTGKSKGFGYVEFATQADLKAALDRSGANLAGRSIRVNVADAPASRPGGRDFGPSVADESNSWRRATPLPARDPPRRTFSGVSSAAGSDDRDWSAARGAKFAPSSRESSGYGRAREHEHEPGHPSAADEADKWRSARPLVNAAPERQGPGGRDPPPHRPTGLADTESTWSRGTRVPQPAAAPAEATRQRLKLAPRSAAASGQNSPEATPAKANPFGAARPVDTHTREVEAEQHAEQRRREAAAAKAKPPPPKVEEKKEERRPVRVHPSRMPPKETAQADEDGFEAVGPRGKAAVAEETKPAAKPATTKQGFSFAAAAGKVDVDVDDVADKVADVSV